MRLRTRSKFVVRWVVGLSFRLLEAIPKCSFPSELRNHPSEPGESIVVAKNSDCWRPEICKSNGSSQNPRRGCEKLPREPGGSPFCEKVYVNVPCGHTGAATENLLPSCGSVRMRMIVLPEPPAAFFAWREATCCASVDHQELKLKLVLPPLPTLTVTWFVQGRLPRGTG